MVDPDEVVRGVLTDHVRELDDGVVGYANLAAFTESIDAAGPGVVVFGPEQSPPTTSITQVAGLVAFRPGCSAIMVVYELTADVLQQALRAGVDDVVAVSAEDAELLDAISRASARVLARGPGVELRRRPPPAPPRRGAWCRSSAPRAGRGSRSSPSTWPWPWPSGPSSPWCSSTPTCSSATWPSCSSSSPPTPSPRPSRPGTGSTAAMLENLLLRHPPSGLLVLAAPTEPSSADQIGRADLTRILDILRERCAYVVVDTSANFAEVTLAAIESSDDILVMAGLDVMSLKSARIGLQTMRVLGIPFSRVKFVLNRANTRVGLTEADAERALQLKVDAALPSDILVAESVNRGVPVVTSAPRSKFAKSIDSLADVLMTAASDPAQSRQSV